MGDDLKQLFDVGELTSAQREEVLAAAKAQAAASNDQLLLAHVDAAFAHEKQLRELEQAYEKSKASRVQYVDELYALDPTIDRQIKVLHSMLKSLSEAAHANPEIPLKAQALLDKVFPRGVGVITRQPFSEQNRLVKDIVAELTGPSATLVADVGLTGMVEALAALSAQYDDAIQRSPLSVAFATLTEAQERAQTFLREVLARVVGMNFRSEVAAERAARGQVLGVLFRALETASERRRTRIAAGRRRRKKDEESGPDSEAGSQDSSTTASSQA